MQCLQGLFDKQLRREKKYHIGTIFRENTSFQNGGIPCLIICIEFRDLLLHQSRIVLFLKWNYEI